jgi:glutathione S-transferase
MIKLYGVRASRALRSLWAIEELGLEYESVPTNTSGDTRTAEFLKLNPNGHIPVLVDDTTVLWESLAINLYLARKYGAGSLWPATVADEGRAFQWSLWAMTELEAPLLAALMHRRLLPEAQRDAAKAAEAEKARG